MSTTPTFHTFTADDIKGHQVSMNDYQGKVVLVVNTASQCGLTPQYEGLESLYQQFHERGLVVLGFPCNQFGNQESGGEEEISEFCQVNYGVSFPMFSKVKVNGSEAHPLFRYLKKATGGFLTDAIKWNFTKFLIDRDGTPVERFAPTTAPEQIAPAIEKLL
ncbi:glutathione peroxidase [Lewinella sp. IMCC34183]|uniref:glutathione peroxidase n=1 Tax=Lewinella sp. IMCC34183 TaxID=2248762 RepID=UPI000E27D7DC|nr:glutathione peroxidase [Lewinella sp. IMCC34183]